MPTSISFSARSNVGLPAAGTVHDVSAMPMLRPWSLTFFARSATLLQRSALLGGRSDDLLQQHGHADAAAAGGVEAVLDGDVVVGDDRLHLGAGVGRGHLGGHLEVHHVAGVVLHDVEHAGAAVDRLGRLHHLVRHRRGEHLTRTGGVEHPERRRTRRASARALTLHRRSGPPCPAGSVLAVDDLGSRGPPELDRRARLRCRAVRH